MSWDGFTTFAALGAMLLLVIAVGRAQSRRLPPEEYERRMEAAATKRKGAIESGALVKLLVVFVALMLVGHALISLLEP